MFLTNQFLLHWQNTNLRKARMKNRVNKTDWKKTGRTELECSGIQKLMPGFDSVPSKTFFYPCCSFTVMMQILPILLLKVVCH